MQRPFREIVVMGKTLDTGKHRPIPFKQLSKFGQIKQSLEALNTYMLYQRPKDTKNTITMIEYYTIGTIAILAAMSPGPDFIIVAKYALGHNRRSALFTSLGITTGVFCHSTYCVLGIALIISQSILIFNTIKYLGSAYLIYLGIKSLRAPQSHLIDTKPDATTHSAWVAFRDGLLTNLLNPKCTLFMLSVFTLVVKPHTPTWIQATYGLEIMLTSIIWFTFLSYGLTLPAIKRRIDQAQHWVGKITGVVLIILGIFVMFEDR